MDVACLAAGEDGLAAVTAAARAVATTGAATAATAAVATTTRAVTATTITTTAARTTATACSHAVHAGAHRVGLRAGCRRAQPVGIAEAAGSAKAGHGMVGAPLLGRAATTTRAAALLALCAA